MFYRVPWAKIGLMAVLLFALGSVQVAAKEDSAIEPTDAGKVAGWIYDAETMQPIADATVCVDDGGLFPQDGKSVGKSDGTGHYACETKLGRKSSKVDWGRVLLSSGIGLLSGSGKKETRRVDISRLLVRVSHQGYKTFEGIVPCREVSPSEFGVTMEPVVLTKTSSSEVSSAVIGWGVAEIVQADVAPSIVRPRGKVSFTITVKCPPVDSKTKPSVVIQSALFGEKKIEKYTASADGSLVFADTYEVSKKAKPTSDSIQIGTVGFPFYFRSGKSKAVQLVQVIKDDSERPTAELRHKAFDELQNGQTAEATADFKTLCTMPGSQNEDRNQMVQLEQAASKTEQAANDLLAGNELEAAIGTAKSNAEADKKNENFAVWHEYAMLMVRKSLTQSLSGSPDANITTTACLGVLGNALKSARSSAQNVKDGNYYGMFGWYGAKVVGVSGFSTPEATNDFEIFRSMKGIQSSPGSYLYHLNLATALVEAQQYDLAAVCAEKCLALNSECTEAKYTRAISTLVPGQIKESVDSLKQVVEVNPRHRQANLYLARIYSTIGDEAAASSYMQSVESFYGKAAKPDMESPIVPSAEVLTTALNPAPVEEQKVEALPPPEPVLPQPTFVNGPNYITANGATYVPLRAICDWIGATLDMNRSSGIIVMKTAASTVSLKLNSTTASINGKLVELPTPAIERNGTSYVPLRFVGEAFAAKVKWYGTTKTVEITHPSKAEVMVLHGG